MIISKVSGLNNTAFGKIEAPVKQYLTEADMAAKKQSQVDTIFPIVTSDNWGEAYSGQTSLQNFKPGGEASRYPEGDFQDDWTKTVANDVTWKQSFPITLEMLEDGKLGAIKDEAQKLVSAYHNTREEYGAEFLRQSIGNTMTFEGRTFNIAGGDGKPLFATNHDSKTGGYSDQSNLFDAEFSYENLTILEAALANQRDANGKKLNLQADTIILPFTTRYDAVQLQKVFEALNADGNPNTADRAGNYHAGRWNVIWWNFLDAPTGMTANKSWFMLMDSKHIETYKSFVMQMRKDLTISSFVDDNTDNNIWKGRSRMIASPTNRWTGILAAIPGLGTTL